MQKLFDFLLLCVSSSVFLSAMSSFSSSESDLSNSKIFILIFLCFFFHLCRLIASLYLLHNDWDDCMGAWGNSRIRFINVFIIISLLLFVMLFWMYSIMFRIISASAFTLEFLKRSSKVLNNSVFNFIGYSSYPFFSQSSIS